MDKSLNSSSTSAAHAQLLLWRVWSLHRVTWQSNQQTPNLSSLLGSDIFAVRCGDRRDPASFLTCWCSSWFGCWLESTPPGFPPGGGTEREEATWTFNSRFMLINKSKMSPIFIFHHHLQINSIKYNQRIFFLICLIVEVHLWWPLSSLEQLVADWILFMPHCSQHL